MSSTQDRKKRKKAKKEAKRKAEEDRLRAIEEEKRREIMRNKNGFSVERDEKRTRLLNDVENVRTIMTDNIDKGLTNYGAVSDLETKAQNLVKEASQFQRIATRVEARAYWDKIAKKVYTFLIGIGVLFLVLGGTFHLLGICHDGEVPLPPTDASLLNLVQKNDTNGNDPQGGSLWIECPTYWMAMGFAADIFLILGFWFRKKLVCCWCDWCSLGRCECCLKCPMACCRECGR